MANCTKKVTAINCKGNSSCEWIDGKCQYKEGEEKNNSNNNGNNNSNNNGNNKNKDLNERFENTLSGFEFNDTCLVITIIFVILFMYKEEIMKHKMVRQLFK